TTLFSWPGKLRMGAELFVPPRPTDDDESIGAFMTRRFGREATAYLAEPLLAGIHAGDVDRLSMNALFPRLVDPESKNRSLLPALRAQNQNPRTQNKNKEPRTRPLTPDPRPPTPDGAFKPPPGGLSEMVRALVKALGEQNVWTNRAVTAITGRGPFVVRT